MSASELAAPAAEQDVAPISRLPWLTPRHLFFFVVGWLILFSLGSIFISNPFASEDSAGAVPDYWRVMYLHGMLIGMVGLLALLTCSILRLRSMHTRMWIVGGVLFATILTAVGGVWDRQIPGAEAALVVQILGFHALDEILVVLLLGMIHEWRARSPNVRSLPYGASLLAAGSMLVAALMGHLAGWIMEFGSWPSAIGAYAGSIGESLDDFTTNLVGSHSHDMVVGVMALAVSIAVVQFGYFALKGRARTLARIGLGLVAVGTLVMTIMYLAMAFTTWSPPTLFTSADGTNGIAGDDIVTGVFVMFGGLLALLAVVGGGDRFRSIVRRPARLAALWSWILFFAVVVIAGYAIELNEVFFGAGDASAAGAANDAVYTWLHQDIGLFLLPALVLVMLAVERYVASGRWRGRIAWATVAGTTITFVGSMIFVFADPALHGPGYIVTTIGLLVVGAALLATIWYGALLKGWHPVAARKVRTA